MCRAVQHSSRCDGTLELRSQYSGVREWPGEGTAPDAFMDVRRIQALAQILQFCANFRHILLKVKFSSQLRFGLNLRVLGGMTVSVNSPPLLLESSFGGKSQCHTGCRPEHLLKSRP